MLDSTQNNVFTESSLVDSVLYKTFNNNSELMNSILSAIKNSIVIDNSYIQEQLLQIKRTRISPLADEVMKAYENGSLVLLHSKVKVPPKALPFFTTKTKGEIKVFIFTNNYGTITKSDTNSEDKFLNITMKDLYVLLEGAYVSYRNATYPIKMVKSLGLMKVSCNIYVNMLMRILNKEYAVGMDKELHQKIGFSIGVFFLRRVWMSENEDIIFSYACNSCKVGNEPIDKTIMLSTLEEINSRNIQTIEELLNYLKSLSPRLNSLNFRYFVQCCINLYKPEALFGLECLPYFLFTIQSAMIGSFIVNQPIIYDILKNVKGMNTFYPELVKSIS